MKPKLKLIKIKNTYWLEKDPTDNDRTLLGIENWQAKILIRWGFKAKKL